MPAAIMTVFMLITISLALSKEGRYEREAMDAVVAIIQHSDKMGDGLDYFEVYGRQLAIDRAVTENNSPITSGPYTVLFRSATYKGDSVFVYRTRRSPFYGVFTFFGERIEVYDHPIYAYDREVMLRRSGAPREIKR